MAQLPEHLSKELLAEFGVPIADFFVAHSAEEAAAEATRLQSAVMVKALLPAGGRGKAGAVLRVDRSEEAAEAFRAVTSIELNEMRATSAIVEPFVEVQAEYYLAVALNPDIPASEVLFSTQGGVDVEHSSQLGRVEIRENGTIPSGAFREMAVAVGVERRTVERLYVIAQSLARAYENFDAVLVELNPLGLTADGFQAVDARLILDDNAKFRQPRIAKMLRAVSPRPLEDLVKEATQLDYVRLGGSLGLISGGAGLTMATIDGVAANGASAACFLDCSANPTPVGYGDALDLVTEDEAVEAVLISIFGGLTRVDSVARTLVALLDEKQPKKPVTIRLMGTNVNGADEVLEAARLKNHHGLEEAIEAADRDNARLCARGGAVSVLIDEKTRLIVQGITGRQATWSTEDMIAYGTTIVGGVVPGRGGETVLERPVFDRVADAVEAVGANASIVYVGANAATEALVESIDAAIPLVVYPGDGLPIKDALWLRRRALAAGVTLVGGNTPGIISPGKAKAGFMPSHCYLPGRVGIITKSGSLSYETSWRLTSAGIGQSTVLGIGGDPVKGVNTAEALQLFQRDSDTEAIVILGEIGGLEEYSAIEYVRRAGAKKVAVLMVGRTAPAGQKLGHAGALINNERETYAAKAAALTDAGIDVVESLADIAPTVAGLLDN